MNLFENFKKADPQQIIVGTPGRVFDMITRKVSTNNHDLINEGKGGFLINYSGYQPKRYQNLRSR